MIPKSEYLHVLSPYHLVVYHDYYYCISLKKENKRIWHYRVDLMSDVEILTTDDKKAVPIDVCTFEELPICNAYWDPEKYMAEHLYMAYDEPREIRIIPSYRTGSGIIIRKQISPVRRSMILWK